MKNHRTVKCGWRWRWAWINAVVLTLAITRGLLAAADAPGEVPALSMSLEFERDEVSAGYPVVVKLRVENPTDASIEFIKLRRLANFSFVLKDDEGEPVPRTRYGRGAARALEFGSDVDRITVKPRDSAELLVPISLRFDMTVAGEYTLSSALMILADSGMLKLKATPVKVRVVEWRERPREAIEANAGDDAPAADQ